MKTKNISINSIALVLLFTCCLTSCDDFLDVKPKSQIESTELFGSEAGFKDALNGVYIKLTSSSLYGQELKYGTLDILGKLYYSVGSGNYSYINSGSYNNSGAAGIGNAIWSNAYNAIASLNALMAEMENADPKMFAQDNYNVIKGEALGLRAFLHFDLLRLFAPSYLVGPDEPAIPYVTEYTYTVTPSSTVSQILEKVIAELEQAASLLKTSDPIATGRAITSDDDDGYLLDRVFHFNYYAAVAALAEAYLWKNDYTNAARCANEVINSGKFSWTPVDNIATNEADRDRTFIPEQIFALQIDNLDDYVLGRVYGTMQYNVTFQFYSTGLTTMFPTATNATDWRRTYFFSNENCGGSYYYTSTKLWQEGMTTSKVKRMPMFRLPEMYLILAECDVPHSAQYVEEVSNHRGNNIKITSTDEGALNDAITMEYVREFMHEGKLFFRYKRINSPQMFTGYYFRKANYNTANYVLPLPNEEKQFGNRE